MEDEAGTAQTARTAYSTITPEFESVLRFLRTLAEPCVPPLGAGGFDVLYASAREVVVWYSPARDDQQAREVVIPADALSAAWASLSAGTLLDEAILAALGLGSWGISWVIALLAQIPGVQVRHQPQQPLKLAWTLLAETSTPDIHHSNADHTDD
jgi:hypothetical protein